MVALDDFIAEALTSIVRGIQKGQNSDVGEHIAPLVQGRERNARGIFHLKDDASNQAMVVQFDVQVATESHNQGEGSAKGTFRLYVVDIDLGTGGQLSTKSSNLHRLQFEVPVKIPVHKTKASVASAGQPSA